MNQTEVIRQKAMLVQLSIGLFSPKKTDKKVTAQVIAEHHADSSAGKFLKRILPEEALEPIQKLAGEARTYHYKSTAPWTDEGWRMLHCEKFDEYRKEQQSNRLKFEGLRDKFLKAYDGYKEAARTMLNGMFNEADYPEADRIAKRFKFAVEFGPLPTGNDFRIDLPEAELAEVRGSIDGRVAQAVSAAQADLWRRLFEPVKHMAERLSDPEAKFKDSLVENIREIVSLVPVLNLTEDHGITRAAAKMDALLTKYEADTLRHQPSIRTDVAVAAKKLSDEMLANVEVDG